MNLPKKTIAEFQSIYFEETGIDLTEQQALVKANDLLNLFQVIYKPFDINKVDGDKYERNQN